MSSFPDVLSATLTYTYNDGSNQPRIFTVPSQYAFAVLQVRGTTIQTQNGISTGIPIKDNLIIKGGESYEIGSANSPSPGSLPGGMTFPVTTVKITALCHKKPS